MKSLRELINEFELFKMTPVDSEVDADAQDDGVDIDVDLGGLDVDGIDDAHDPAQCSCPCHKNEVENEIGDEDEDFNLDIDTPLDSFDNEDDEFNFFK